jgi:hypothetical protein
MLNQNALSAIERTGNAVRAGVLVRLRREVRKDKTRSQEGDPGSEKARLQTVGEAAHTLRSTLVLALVGTGNFLLLQFFYNYLCLLPRLPVAFVGVEVSLTETNALRRDLDVLTVANPFDGLFEG